MKRTLCFTIVLCIAWSVIVQAQYSSIGFRSDVSKVGTTAAPFLTIGIGARANAMGGAFVSVANDVTALFWNPAGIASLHSNELTLIHSDWIADLRHDFIGFAAPMGVLGSVGFSLNALTMGEIDVRTIDYPEGYGEKAESYDLALGISYARSLTDRLSIGGTVKYIRSQLWHMSAQTMAVDLGVIFSDIFNFIQLGASISNMGGKIKYNGRDVHVYHDIASGVYGNNDKIDADLRTGKYNLPIAFRTGISTIIKEKSNMPLLLAVELFQPSDNVRSMNIGTEWSFYNMVFLRGGYSSLFEVDTEKGLTLGGGINLEVVKSVAEIKLDYCYEDFGILDNSQKFSITVAF